MFSGDIDKDKNDVRRLWTGATVGLCREHKKLEREMVQV